MDDIIVPNDNMCPQCGGPFVRDEWNHSRFGWECVNCELFIPDPDSEC